MVVRAVGENRYTYVALTIVFTCWVRVRFVVALYAEYYCIPAQIQLYLVVGLW
jgi:hypothetical protein